MKCVPSSEATLFGIPSYTRKSVGRWVGRSTEDKEGKSVSRKKSLFH
jgi:hypothetical protein